MLNSIQILAAMDAQRRPSTGRVALWACPRDHPGTVFGPAAMRPQPGGGVGEKRDRRGGSGELPPAWDPAVPFEPGDKRSEDPAAEKAQMGSQEASPVLPIAPTPPERACAAPSYPPEERQRTDEGGLRCEATKAGSDGGSDAPRCRGLTFHLIRTARQHCGTQRRRA